MTSNTVAKLETVEWLSQRLDISLPRAYELVRRGLVPAVRVGRQIRVDPAKVEAWIEAGGQPLPGGWRREAE